MSIFFWTLLKGDSPTSATKNLPDGVCAPMAVIGFLTAWPCCLKNHVNYCSSLSILPGDRYPANCLCFVGIFLMPWQSCFS